MTFTYEPGASSIAGTVAPGSRAGTVSGARRDTQRCQSGHQEPAISVAIASHSSGLSGVEGATQWLYLPESGWLTTPAIWPEAASTKRFGPFMYFSP
jgi:hypothetical protein